MILQQGMGRMERRRTRTRYHHRLFMATESSSELVTKKYEAAISCYHKAVALDRQRWLSRLGFLKCVFAKDYNSTLTDLTDCTEEYGLMYEQAHSLEFYMGVCLLQLNQNHEAQNYLSYSSIVNKRVFRVVFSFCAHFFSLRTTSIMNAVAVFNVPNFRLARKLIECKTIQACTRTAIAFIHY